MDLSWDDLIAGEEAYERMLAFQYKYKPSVWLLAMMAVLAGIYIWLGIWLGNRNGNYGLIGNGISTMIVLLAVAIWQYRRQKKQYQKDYEFLKILKSKYGPEIYSKITKESCSFYYRTCLKRYPLDNRRDLVSLP